MRDGSVDPVATAMPSISTTRAATIARLVRGGALERSSLSQSCSHSRASNSVPRTPIYAVVALIWITSGLRFPTRPLIARRGLALRLGERSRGHQDPGATSCFLLVRAMLPDRHR